MKTLRAALLGLVVSLCACRGNSGPPAFNLEPLMTFSGVSDWTAAGGGPGHTGYVPVTLDPARFSLRWRVTLPLGDSGTGPCTGGPCDFILPSTALTDSAHRRVFLTTEAEHRTATDFSVAVELLSLDEDDGKRLWDVGHFPSTSGNDGREGDEYAEPAFFDGRVYLSYYVKDLLKPPLLPPFIDAYDALTGGVAYKQAAPCTSICYPTQPVASSTTLYAGAPLSAYDAHTGSVLWTDTTGDSEIDFAAPALDAGGVYVSSQIPFSQDPLFVAYDPGNGAELFKLGPSAKELALEKSENRTLSAMAPFADGVGGVLAVHQGLTSAYLNHYSESGQALDWQVSGHFGFSPGVVAHGIVYICDGNAVDALDDATGSLLWQWTPPTDVEFGCYLIATDNLLFVSNLEATYALDLASRLQVWSYPVGGRLSVSPSGILYISAVGPEAPHPTTPDLGMLIAINLH